MTRFRLQSVLDYRKIKEDTAQKSFLICIEERRTLTEKMEEGQRELRRLFEKLDERKRNGIVLSEMMLFEDCIVSKKSRLNDIRNNIETLSSKIQEKRRQLVEARQEKRVLEILKESRQEEERKNDLKRECMLLDEIAVLCFGAGK